MDCSWHDEALKMLSKRDRYTEIVVRKEFFERIKNKISYDSDLDRRLESGEGGRLIFATRVCDNRYTLYWEFDKNKSVAYVLAFFPNGGASYFRSVSILEDFINFFKQTSSFSKTCNEVVKKNNAESIVKYW